MRRLRPLALALALAAAALPAAAQPAPQALIETATERLLDALVERGDDLRADPSLAYALAEDTLFGLVDFERIGRYALGKHWRQASPKQRLAYQRAFRDYAADAIVTAMVQYSEEMVSHADRLSFPPTRWQPGDDEARVRMQVRLRAGSVAEVQYRMRRADSGWQVFDVTLEGVSLVLMYRDAFAQDIQRYGLDGLIERMVGHNRERRG